MTYRFLNRVLVIVGVVLAVAICVAHLKGVGGCGWRILFGKDCILCGCTRDAVSIVKLNIQFINPLSPYILTIMLGEFVYRCLGSFALMPARAWIIDAAFHGVAAIAFLVANFIMMFR